VSDYLADAEISISGLARLSGLDRATVVKRLGELTPVSDRANERCYLLGPALRELLRTAGSEYDAARTQKLKAEAALAELELAQEKGEVLPAQAVRQTLTELWQRVYRRCVVQLPEALLPAFRKAEDDTHRVQIVRGELQQIFDELRRDHAAFE
jgi:hypothetical protein